MTQRITEKNVYFYYKLLVHATQKQFTLSHWDNSWKLFCNTDKGNVELSRVLSTIEMYEVLYSLGKVSDLLGGQYEYSVGKTKELSKQDAQMLKEKLHDENYINVVEE